MFKQCNNKNRPFFKSKDDQNNARRMKRSIQNRWINWEKCWGRRMSCSTETCVTQTYRFLGGVWSSGLRTPLTSQRSIHQTVELNYSLSSATLSCPKNAALCQNGRFLRTRGACFKAKRAHSGGSRTAIRKSSSLVLKFKFLSQRMMLQLHCERRVWSRQRARWNTVPSSLQILRWARGGWKVKAINQPHVVSPC